MQLLLNLNKEKNTTLIIVTHDPEVAELTERIVMIRDGVVVEDKNHEDRTTNLRSAGEPGFK